MEGNGCDVIKIITTELLERNEEHHRHSDQILGTVVEISTWGLSHTSRTLANITTALLDMLNYLWHLTDTRHGIINPDDPKVPIPENRCVTF